MCFIPVQLIPFPSKVLGHEHSNEPIVFLHVACWWQYLSLLSHSLISENDLIRCVIVIQTITINKQHG